MSYSDIEHFSSIVSGCEALTNGNGNSPDGLYALTVLKLHANDAGLYAGQEGFVDAIKKGAKKTKQWILELVKAIRAWIKDKYKASVKKAMGYMLGSPDNQIKHAALTKVANKLESLDKAYEQLEMSSELKDANLSTSFSMQRGQIDKALKSLGSSDDFNGKEFLRNLDKILEQATAKVNDFTEVAERLAKEIPDDLSAENYNEKSKRAMGMSRAINILTSPTEILGRSILALAEQTKATSEDKA